MQKPDLTKFKISGEEKSEESKETPVNFSLKAGREVEG